MSSSDPKYVVPHLTPGGHRLPSGFQLLPDLEIPGKQPPLFQTVVRLIPYPVNYVSPRLTTAGDRLPSGFLLWPELKAADLPAVPPIPPIVQSNDLITSLHENTVTNALDSLWIDVQFLAAQAATGNPLTTKGDLIVQGASAAARLPVGANGLTLIADSQQALGLRWGALNANSVGAVPTTRQVLAGAGMSGGGALSADVTLHANVISVFGRTGAIVASVGDYTAAQITNAVSTIGAYADPSWLTSLAYSKLTGVPASFFPSPHVHAASDIASGVMATARLGSGAASSATYLRGDGTWAGLQTSFYANSILVAQGAKLNLIAGPNVVLSGQATSGSADITISAAGGETGGMLDPTTTLGDLIVRGPSTTVRLSVGNDGHVLISDAAEPLGVRWGPQAGAVLSVFERAGAVVAQAGDYSADLITNAVSDIGSYADPAWLTALAWSKLTGAPSSFPPVAHVHAASEITTGIMDVARLGSGTPSAATYLSGAGVWTILPVSSVTSVFTRTGAIVSQTGDYTVAQVTGAVPDTRQVLPGVGLTGGGPLTGDVTLNLNLAAVQTAAQTPWIQNIEAQNFKLSGVGGIGIGTDVLSSPVKLRIISTNTVADVDIISSGAGMQTTAGYGAGCKVTLQHATGAGGYRIINSLNHSGGVYMGGSDNGWAYAIDSMYLETSAANGIIFVTNGNKDRMRISDAGNVSIGTTDTTYRFQVSGGRTLLTDATQPYALGMRNSAAGAVVWQGADATGNWILSAAGGNQIASIDTASNLTVAQTVTSYISNTARAVFRSNVAGTGFTQTAIEINQTNLAAGTDMNNCPRISFHWTLQVASQIGMDNTGCIRTFNNPGTAYERFAAASIVANGDLTVTSNATISGYVSATGVIQSGASLKTGVIGQWDYTIWRFSGDGYMYIDGSQAGASGYMFRVVDPVGTQQTPLRIGNSGVALKTIDRNLNAPVAGSPNGGVYFSYDGNWGIQIGHSGDGSSWIQSTRSDAIGANYPLYLNPLGGNIGIGCTAAYQAFSIITPNVGTAAECNHFSIGEGSNNSAYRLKLGYYIEGVWKGMVQALAGNAGTPLCLNPQGGVVGCGTSNPQNQFDCAGMIRSTGVGPVPTSGVGIEYFWNGAQGAMHAIDRATSTYRNLSLDGAILILNEYAGPIVQKVPPTAPVDTDIRNSCMTIWYDQASNALRFRVKSSAGVIKVGTLAVA